MVRARRSSIRPVSPVNSGTPRPNRMGLTITRSSSTTPASSRLAVNVELPKRARSPSPGCCLSSSILATGSVVTSSEFSHVASVSVDENTSLCTRFMRRAVTGSVSCASGVGQNCAMCSYVARPNSSVSMSFIWRIENSWNSPSTLGQSNSPAGPTWTRRAW